jgi:hypothetical protein
MADQAYSTGDPDPELVRHAVTYHRFMLGVKWVAIHFAAVLTFLILWFASPAGFIGGAVAGALVFGVGVYAMGHGLAHSSERDNPTGPAS